MWRIYLLKYNRMKNKAGRGERHQEENSIISQLGHKKRQLMSKRVYNPTHNCDVDENKSKRIIPECDEM